MAATKRSESERQKHALTVEANIIGIIEEENNTINLNVTLILASVVITLCSDLLPLPRNTPED